MTYLLTILLVADVVLPGANALSHEREGRTPRELAVKIRDDCNQPPEAVKANRGDIDLTIQLLTDAESKYSDTSVHEKGHKSSKTSYSSAPALGDIGESRSSVPNKLGKSKSLGSVALGNALTGLNCCFIAANSIDLACVVPY